jgi:hypothetical protein
MPRFGAARFLIFAALVATTGGTLPKGERPTYRMLQVTCARCDLEQLVQRLAGRDAKLCLGSELKSWKDVSACMAAARAGRRAFAGSVSVRGIDAAIAYGFVGSTDGSVDQFWYDSDPSGGCTPCNGVIVRWRCSEFTLDANPGEGCTVSGRYVVCSEASHRTLNLGPPLDASGLFCPDSTFTYMDPGHCSRTRGAGLRSPLSGERIACTDECSLMCSINEGKLLHASYYEEAAPDDARSGAR